MEELEGRGVVAGPPVPDEGREFEPGAAGMLGFIGDFINCYDTTGVELLE